jgi:hypothetical protein
MWAGGCEIDFVVNLELLARTVIGHAVFQTDPGVARVVDVRFAFHIEVVIGAGKPDDAATADYAATAAKPNQAVTAQRVNVVSPMPRPPEVMAAWTRLSRLTMMSTIRPMSSPAMLRTLSQRIVENTYVAGSLPRDGVGR